MPSSDPSRLPDDDDEDDDDAGFDDGFDDELFDVSTFVRRLPTSRLPSSDDTILPAGDDVVSASSSVFLPRMDMRSGAAADRMDDVFALLTPAAFEMLAVSSFSLEPRRWLTIFAPSLRSTFLKKDERFDVLSPAWLWSALRNPAALPSSDAWLLMPPISDGSADVRTLVTSFFVAPDALAMPFTLDDESTVERTDEISMIISSVNCGLSNYKIFFFDNQSFSEKMTKNY